MVQDRESIFNSLSDDDQRSYNDIQKHWYLVSLNAQGQLQVHKNNIDKFQYPNTIDFIQDVRNKGIIFNLLKDQLLGWLSLQSNVNKLLALECKDNNALSDVDKRRQNIVRCLNGSIKKVCSSVAVDPELIGQLLKEKEVLQRIDTMDYSFPCCCFGRAKSLPAGNGSSKFP